MTTVAEFGESVTYCQKGTQSLGQVVTEVVNAIVYRDEPAPDDNAGGAHDAVILIPVNGINLTPQVNDLVDVVLRFGEPVVRAKVVKVEAKDPAFWALSVVR